MEEGRWGEDREEGGEQAVGGVEGRRLQLELSCETSKFLKKRKNIWKLSSQMHCLHICIRVDFASD